MEEGRSAFKILTGKLTEKRLLEWLTWKWKDNLRMDLKDIGTNTRNWVDRLRIGITGVILNAALNPRVP